MIFFIGKKRVVLIVCRKPCFMNPRFLFWHSIVPKATYYHKYFCSKYDFIEAFQLYYNKYNHIYSYKKTGIGTRVCAGILAAPPQSSLKYMKMVNFYTISELCINALQNIWEIFQVFSKCCLKEFISSVRFSFSRKKNLKIY